MPLPDQPSEPPSNDPQKPPLWMGPGFMLLALVIAFQHTSPGVPQWIGYATALATFLGGIAVTGIAFGMPEISNSLGPAIIAVMAIIPTWISIGPGERHCSGGLSFLGFSLTHGGDVECRVAFGFGALMLWAMLGAGLWSMCKKK